MTLRGSCSPQRLIHFEVWRWAFFFAGQAPVYFLGELIVHVCFLFAESLFFKVTYAFYYAVSVKVTPLVCHDPCMQFVCSSNEQHWDLEKPPSADDQLATVAGYMQHDLHMQGDVAINCACVSDQTLHELPQKPAARLIRTCLLIGLYLWIFSDGEEQTWPPELLLTYQTVLKALLCLLLFCTADLIKAMLAKTVSGHFHTSLHFMKMQDALNKVRMAGPSSLQR